MIPLLRLLQAECDRWAYDILVAFSKKRGMEEVVREGGGGG